ncbi:MAG: murein biosynthesis integral membrane protein MurJ, partial [Candidatus Omnitrophota bacterium]|nr:murein biosynthesis integral membrane protein MurJ [Candidatus Omnitrophota bacterium]
EYKQKYDKNALWEFMNVILILALMILSVLTLIGILFAPWIVRVMAPGFIAEPQKLSMTIQLTKLMFPYVILIGLTAYSVGILFTFKSFAISAFSPCLLNLAMIAGACISFYTSLEPVYWLAISVLVGGVLQLAVQIPPMFKIGFRLKKPKSLKHPGAMQIGRLLIPRMFGSGIYQLTVFIDSFCASLAFIVGPGGISAIYYSNRIIQFPMGIFSVALASAVLPSLSGLASRKDMAALKKMIVFSLENIFFIMCPTTVIILFLSNPIIRVLFQRGEFDLHSTTITASALAFYSIGLFSFGGIKILVTSFYALQDTKTPVKVAGACLLINVALNFVLMFPLKVGGIALASSIAGTIDFLVLLYIMEKRLGGLNSDLLSYFLKVISAAGLIGVFEFWSWNHWSFSNEVVKLFCIGGLGFVLYEIICLGLKVEQAQKIWEWIKKGIGLKG